MKDLRPLRGEDRRIKFLPCPDTMSEGDVPVKTRIGEIECEYCGNGAMAYVCVGKKQHVYAFHNEQHPRAWPDDNDRYCGRSIIKTDVPDGRLIIRHWRAQKETKNDAPKPKPAPAAVKPTKPAAAKPAAGKPAAKPGPAAQRDDTAPARTGTKWPWGG